MRKIFKLFTFAVILCCANGFISGAENKNNTTGNAKDVEPDTKYIISNRFVDNTFVSFNGGGTLLFGRGMGKRAAISRLRPAAMIDVSFGKWLSPVWGGRINISGGNLAAYAPDGINARSGMYESASEGLKRIEGSFFSLGASMMMNWQNIVRINPQRVYSLIPYAHIGLMADKTTETIYPSFSGVDLVGGVGLLNYFRISNQLGINIDLRGYLLGAKANITDPLHKTLMGTITAGITYNIGRTDWASNHSYTDKLVRGYYDGRFFDNAFISLMGGAHIAGGQYKGAGAFADLSVGKWFRPHIGGRVGYSGGLRPIGNGARRMLSYAHADLMFPCLKPESRYNIAPYISVGMCTGIGSTTPFKLAVGAYNRFSVSDKVEIVLDGRALLLGRSNLLGSVSLGLAYNLGKSDWEKATSKVKSDSTVDFKRWAISTNLAGFYDWSLNADVQYALARHWSFESELGFNIHPYSQNRKQFISFGARYWPWFVYSGFWFKASGNVVKYFDADNRFASYLNLNSRNSLPERGTAYGAGISAGYSLMVSKVFNIDFGFGGWGGIKRFVQYTDAKFNTPSPEQTRFRKWFFGISDIRISAMFVF